MKEGFEERLQELLGSDEFDSKLEAFMARYSGRVVRNSEVMSGESKGREGEFEGGEFSHDVYSIYDKYVLMIEGILEKFQESEGMNNHEFKVAMEDMQKIDPAMVKLIICTWEFGYFLDICKDFYDSNGYGEVAESKSDLDKDDDAKHHK